MAFLRVKRTAGRVYAYLVESRWDPAVGHPKQRVIAYLGRLDRLRPDAVPEPYRTPAILRALETRVAAERQRLRAAAAGPGASFLESLLAGDRATARSLARRTIRELGAEGFYSDVLVPSLHEIGRRFAHRQISISTEHLATGIAAGVLTEMNAKLPEVAPGSPEVVLCVPEGESHTVPLQIAEGVLRRKGYRTLNVAGSAPTPSLLEFVRVRRPEAVLISVTIPDRFESGWKLARQLRRQSPGVRVALGGQGIALPPATVAPEGIDLVRTAVEEYLGVWPDATGGRGSRALSGAPSRRVVGREVGRE